jgi:hypothetical protein
MANLRHWFGRTSNPKGTLRLKRQGGPATTYCWLESCSFFVAVGCGACYVLLWRTCWPRRRVLEAVGLRQHRAAARSSIRRNQRQYGKGRRRIGHEHPAPGFAFLAAVFAVKVE